MTLSMAKLRWIQCAIALTTGVLLNATVAMAQDTKLTRENFDFRSIRTEILGLLA